MNPAATTRTSPLALPVLGAALLLGLLADQLFFGASDAGINLVIGVAALAAMAHATSYRFHGALNGTDPWLLVAIGFASCLAVRDAESLRAANTLAVLCALGIAGLAQRVEPRIGWLRDYFLTLVNTARCVATGVPVLLGNADWASLRRGDTFGRTRRVVAGLVLAIPIVLVFGALFASADPAFNALARRLVGWNLAPLVNHAFVTGLFTWLTAGLLRAWLWTPAPSAQTRSPTEFVPIGHVPVQIAVGAMVLVFGVFTAIQARWLIGGEAAVLAGTGLTYAALARQGFNEMVAASALAIPVLYGALVLHDGAPARTLRSLRRLGAVQLVLVLLTMGSALSRVRMYTEAYGLSTIRINGTAVIVWLGAVIAWFGFTALRGRRERFTFGAVTSGFAVLGLLNIANPDAMIVRVNSERAVRGAVLDRDYLNALSADAAPALAERLRVMTVADACDIGAALRKRWLDPAVGSDWRTWNLSVSRARAAAEGVNLAALGCGS